MKRVVLVFLAIVSLILTLSGCGTSGAKELSLENYSEILGSIDKYKNKEYQFSGTALLFDEYNFLVPIGNSQQNKVHVSLSKVDEKLKDYSTVKVTGKIVGLKNERILIQADTLEVLGHYYDIDSAKIPSEVALTNKDYPAFYDDYKKHVGQSAEFEAIAYKVQPKEGDKYIFDVDLDMDKYNQEWLQVFTIERSLTVVFNKDLELKDGENPKVKIKGVLIEHPLGNKPIIIAQNVELVDSNNIDEQEVTPAQEESKTNVEQTPEPGKKDSQPSTPSNGSISRDQAIQIVKQKYPGMTVESYEEDDLIYPEKEFYYMNVVPGTSPAFEIYVDKSNGDLFSLQFDGKLMMID